MECPAAFELLLYSENSLSDRARDRVRRHLKECPRCLKYVRELQAGRIALVQPMPVPECLNRHLEGFEPLPTPPEDVRPGQIWLAADVPGILLVTAVLENPDSYAAYPLSFYTAYLSDRDFWLSRSDTPFGSPMMVETWLDVPIDRQALGCFVGVLDQSLMDSVERLRSCRASEADSARVGPPVLRIEDPRYEHQRREMTFWQPASARVLKRIFALDEEAAATSQEPEVTLLRGFLANKEIVARVDPLGLGSYVIRWLSYPTEFVKNDVSVWAPSRTGTLMFAGKSSGSVRTISLGDHVLSLDKPWPCALVRADQELELTEVVPAAGYR